jgi:hypothetical protein
VSMFQVCSGMSSITITTFCDSTTCVARAKRVHGGHGEVGTCHGDGACSQNLVTSHREIADDEETTGECTSSSVLRHVQTDGSSDSRRRFIAREVAGPVANQGNECQPKTSLLESDRLKTLHVIAFRF